MLEEDKNLLYGIFATGSDLASKLRHLLHSWASRLPQGNRKLPPTAARTREQKEVSSPIGRDQQDAFGVTPKSSERRPIVFICYARADNDGPDRSRKWLDRVLEHLAPLALDDCASLWSDKDIDAGREGMPRFNMPSRLPGWHCFW
jgi:hypothetical protein